MPPLHDLISSSEFWSSLLLALVGGGGLGGWITSVSGRRKSDAESQTLPTAPNVVGGAGTRAVVGGVDYVFDGAGLWVQQTQLGWTVCDTGTIGYYVPQASATIQALSVRKQHGIVELMGRIAVGGTVKQNSDMGAMIPDGYRPTTTTMIQSDQTGYGHMGPPFLVKPDGHIIWGPSMSNATDAVFHGMWVCA